MRHYKMFGKSYMQISALRYLQNCASYPLVSHNLLSATESSKVHLHQGCSNRLDGATPIISASPKCFLCNPKYPAITNNQAVIDVPGELRQEMPSNRCSNA